MKQLVLGLFLSVAAVAAAMPRHAALGIKAFNAAVPSSTETDAVFSPYSFELDCAVFGEAFPAIQKAQYAEKLGTLSGFDTVYPALQLRYGEVARSNLFSVVMARAFCLPEVRLAKVPYRTLIQNCYRAQVCHLYNKYAADAWFHTMLDGELDSFSVAEARNDEFRYSYYDVVSVRPSWERQFPTQGVAPLEFHCADGKVRKLPALRDRRDAELYTVKGKYTLLRLQLTDGVSFYAMLPKENFEFVELRRSLNANTVDGLLAMRKATADPDVRRGPVDLAMPVMDMVGKVDLVPIFGFFGLPTSGFYHIARSDGSDLTPKCVQQTVRFRLDAEGLGELPKPPKTPEEEEEEEYAASRQLFAPAEPVAFALDRPFVFFVYHEPTDTITVAGIFTGVRGE